MGGNGVQKKKLVLRVVLLCACFATLATALTVLAADPVIEQADTLYSNRVRQPGSIDKGIALLDGYLVTHVNSYDALWRQARFYWFKGDRSPEKKKLPHYEDGKAYAELAVLTNPNGVEGHYWLGSLTGAVGTEKGILNSLFMVAGMKEQIEIVLKLDPNYHDAYNVYAQLLWKLPGRPLSIGDKKKAQEYAKKATELSPDTIGHWLLLGEIAISNKDYAIARTAFNKVLALPDNEEDLVKSKEQKTKATTLLKEIQNK
ncbi:MAG TPA: hypothetical protein DHD79_02800 [Firmicutes bacterium]|jgi:tetratricopeptide (TPR) repeat protein|nr:hypothetical protein [Bacillota bacterium]HBL67674.1 hypothetical protein [Bacillota bacterium]HCX70152.1 hypothetical protein [Bacillota bacterium]